jgi:hypothetical protein
VVQFPKAREYCGQIRILPDQSSSTANFSALLVVPQIFPLFLSIAGRIEALVEVSHGLGIARPDVDG